MTENVTTMPAPAAGRAMTAEDERQGLDRMAARADEMERICRRLIREQKVAAVREASELEDRYREERSKLEAFHVKRMADLEHSLKRIEALRSA